jgi:GT2 family glycosyltransferase
MIPKVIHQIWIGPKPAPAHMMKTWKEKHPGFEYILWNEKEIAARGLTTRCQKQIDAMAEINGKADIYRWEILHRYGGYFVDADSICVEPFDQFFEGVTAFATYENENVRANLIATGTMGFVPGHPLCRDILYWIETDPEAQTLIKATRAWYSVGPGLLTKMLDTGKYPDVTIYPSHCFLPIHFTGPAYTGHKRVYGYQEWGTAKQSYDTMAAVQLPESLKSPPDWYSILITSYNTPVHYIHECLESIKAQTGYFGIEVVWVDDGSTKENSDGLIKELSRFKRTSRFTQFVYLKNDTNQGTAKSSNRGLEACSNELVFKMDSDDLMFPDRMSQQIAFMTKSPDVVACGANIRLFSTDAEGRKQWVNETHHPQEMTWNELYRTQPSWYVNNPTLCYRKSAILRLGGYRTDDDRILYVHEDYDLMARVIKVYGRICSLPSVLVLYRLHFGQLTYLNKTDTPEMAALRREILERTAQLALFV